MQPRTTGDAAVDPAVSAVLARTTVAELATITRDGGLRTRPMSSTWSSDGRIVLSTPVAYAQKVADIRRDGRVAILYSDFTGSGLDDPAPVLVEGTATAPDVVAAPQDMAEYWRCLVDRNPVIAADAASPGHRRDLDWYYWRLPIFVQPETVRSMARAEAGGIGDGGQPTSADLSTRIDDALRRYPTAVVALRRSDGRPWLARTTVHRRGTSLVLQPVEQVRGVRGPANLLWHRHGGAGAMSDLLVHGNVAPNGDGLVFEPDHAARSLDDATYDQWVSDGRTRSLRYLARHDLSRPQVDWTVLRGGEIGGA